MRMLILIAMLMVVGGGTILFAANGAIQEIEGVLLIGFGLTIGAIIGMNDKQVKLLREVRDLLQKMEPKDREADASAQVD